MGLQGQGRIWVGGMVALVMIMFISLFGSVLTATAAAPAELLRIPLSGTPEGSGAGELKVPRDSVVDVETGHIFVTELGNARISEFTAWGGFVKAWGWDVAPGAVDEEQEVRVRASEGQFRLGFEGDETADLEFDASAEEVQNALNGLPSISAGGGGVTVSGGTGTTLRVYLVRFGASPLSGVDVDQLTASDGTVPLGGGSPLSEVTVATRANGTAGGAGLESCTMSSGCKAGSVGDGAGQFDWPTGLTLGHAGDLYVYEVNNRRVQKFDPAGEFLLMFGGEVNQGGGVPSSPGNLCTAQHLDNGDVCGAGASGTAPGYLQDTLGNYIARSEVADAILVGDEDRVQEFNEDGTFKGEIPLEGDLDGKTVRALAVDSSGATYLSFAATEGIFKLSAAGVPVGGPYPLDVPEPVALETDAEDNLYAVEGNGGVFTPDEVLGFDADGACIEEMCLGDEFATVAGDTALGLGANLCVGSEPPGNLYVVYGGFTGDSHVDAYGSPPIGCEPPPIAAPTIVEQYATMVDLDGASVRAEINPHFWPDATYSVQYGSAPCSAGGCTNELPVPGASLTTKSVSIPVRTAEIFLGGLQPGTTYFYRFVAQSGGGGPTVGAEKSFRTFRRPTLPEPCVNDGFRNGPSAELPDCRAYEMASALEKGNGDVLAPNVTGLQQATPSGDGLTYTSTTPSADPEGAPSVSQFIARREGGGWASEAISPPRTRVINPGGLAKLDNEFKLFSPDLCNAWLRTVYDPPLTTDAVPKYFNLYRRQNCGPQKGSYEALTTVQPPTVISKAYDGLEIQGLSEDGTRSVYAANDSLTSGASVNPSPPNPQGSLQLYERSPQGLRYVCVLPDETPVDPEDEACYAGTARDFFGDGQEGTFHNAISADGRRIFWSAGEVGATGSGLGGGRIFVRIDPDFGSDGDEVSLDVSKAAEEASGTDTSVFWGAARNGSRAVFTTGGDLYGFEVDSETTIPIAEEVTGVLGASEDATRVYFVSRAALPGSGQNSEGNEAIDGRANLYLWTRDGGGPGAYAFIGTLAGAGEAAVAPSPLGHRARVTPDGGSAAFISTASLTGYDNIDVETGTPATEVFLYDAAADELRCVSCNPTGARPRGRPLLNARGFPDPSGLQAAAQIPGYPRSLYASRLLSEDGRRLFFESNEALVPRDTNNRQDVYQWEEDGKGSCTSGDGTFVPEAGGCVDLISSGESPRDSEFLDATPSGDDVFFSTLSSLVPPDYGLVDIYDARVGGGFSYPEPEPPCEGEACQSPPPAPPLTTPSSSVYEGPGDPPVSKVRKPRRCPKGKRKARRGGKTRCVKKAKQAKKRKARSKGRAGR